MATMLFAALGYIAPGSDMYAWTAGAIGSMAMAVMTRASLGEIGQALHASAAIQPVNAVIHAPLLCRERKGGD
ncbi:NnrS family protein [Tardiphaga sp. 768_D3_N2_1]|uniref:NnrS family protein n=1 Tax=Tardiphaga sp. 768_D3_N2_1 TaxID=3240783 RepID=UPI003F8C6A0C